MSDRIAALVLFLVIVMNVLVIISMLVSRFVWGGA